VIEVSLDVILEGALDPAVSQYTFTMCNPPFFRDIDERLGSSTTGSRPPAGTCSTASDGEAITPGGEREFVERIIQDSLKLKHRVRLVHVSLYSHSLVCSAINYMYYQLCIYNIQITWHERMCFFLSNWLVI